MSLYTSVYWTKRALVVLALVLFVCSGIRVFQIISSSFTKTDTQISATPPELGFGKLNPLVLSSIQTGDFNPTTFRISTTKGNLDVDNQYPLESTTLPLSNVYRITEKEISLSTTEDPLRIARAVGFTKNPVEVSSTERSWSESGRNLEIDGLYISTAYSNDNLKKSKPEALSPLAVTDQNSLKTFFANALKTFDIQSDLTGYTFDGDLVNYDLAQGKFVGSGSLTSGQYLRINARRAYPNLAKTDSKAQTKAAYPNYPAANNYLIIPTGVATTAKMLDVLVELGLYNWPINQTIAASNPAAQTYPIKTPREAYNELVSSKGTLVYAAESKTRKEINISELSGVSLVDILSIKVEMYEDKTNLKFIQPVYVFVTEVEKSNKKYTLIYYIPAVAGSSLK